VRFARDGDTVVVHSEDRLARNLDDLRALVQGFTRKGVRVKFVKESLAFTGEDSPMANLMLSVRGSSPNSNGHLSGNASGKVYTLAKQRGEWKGRKKTLAPERADELVQRAGISIPKVVLARDYGIRGETVPTSITSSPAAVRSPLDLLLCVRYGPVKRLGQLLFSRKGRLRQSGVRPAEAPVQCHGSGRNRAGRRCLVLMLLDPRDTGLPGIVPDG
jgi:hypothetical protein